MTSEKSLAQDGTVPLARHAVRRERHPLLRVLSILGVVLAVLVVSVGGVAAYAVWDAFAGISENSVDLAGDAALPPSIGEIEGGVNVLMVGSDSCEGQDVALFPRCAADDAAGERNDVTMLVHISDEPRRITVVSFPRDMLVPIPACPDGEGGEYEAMESQPLNASYQYGGLACTALTIQELTGEEIQFAAAIRWTGVIDISNAIGGVDVCVSSDISDPDNTGLALAAGTHTLQGVEALQFLRMRHGIGDGSDLGRISNQQQFMSSLVRTLKFVQYPTQYTSDFVNVLPLREAADPLFAALRANQALTLTGEASQGSGVDVTGEATEPDVGTDEEATPVPSESAAAQARVELPSEIAGTTAAQVTCTRAEQ